MSAKSARQTVLSDLSWTMLLPYKSPFDWDTVLAAFRGHQLLHLEAVDDIAYERVVATKQSAGWFRVEHEAKRSAVRLSGWEIPEHKSAPIAQTVRRMFDLDVNPAVIGQAMKADRCLAAIWQRYPGLRVARSWSGFESMVTTVLGQLVSVSFGRILTDELMRAAGKRARHPKTGEQIHLFPSAKALLTADMASVRTSERRKMAIRSLAQLVCDGSLREEMAIAPIDLRKVLLSVPGIGVWTAEYVAMRGFRDDDAFPATDYGLKQELKRHPETNVNRIRPWRAYAATALWKSFGAAKGVALESVL